jgi:hypothetical protein
MRPADLLFVAASIAAGAWAGEALGRLPGGVIGAAVGLAAGSVVPVLGVRLSVAAPVVIGTLAGGLLGRSIVRALCLPGSCHSAEVVAALLTGAGSLVGVGLVVALVTRSFDEYRESNRGGKPAG